MAYEQREADISIFQNDRKGNEKAPTLRGTALWRGEKIKFSLWTKGEKDRKFWAGRIESDQPAPPKSAPVPLPESEPLKIEEDGDILPF